MTKVEVFDIITAKEDQRKSELELTPIQRLHLCLDLMHLSASLTDKQNVAIPEDGIDWIDLSFNHD